MTQTNTCGNVSRRSFLAGAALTAGAAVTSKAMAKEGPSSNLASSTGDMSASTMEDFDPNDVDEVMNAELLIVGAGVAGVAAAVEAADRGIDTIVIESNDSIGSAASGTEGVFAIDSPQHIRDGVHINPSDIISTENSLNAYRINNLFLRDFLDNCLENYNWLVDKGVEFSGVADNYKGSGLFPTHHWFANDGYATTSYFPQMSAYLDKFDNVEIVTGLRGRKLVTTNDKVTGIVATREDDSTVRIDAEATIICTGGYAGNADILKRRDPRFCAPAVYGFSPTVGRGDGLEMVRAIGGSDVSAQRGFLAMVGPSGSDSLNAWVEPTIWVNGDGYRYVNEDCDTGNPLWQHSLNAFREQASHCFMLVDSGLVKRMSDAGTDTSTLLEDIASYDGPTTAYAADTLEELAEKAGFDPAVFLGEVDRYNALVDAGADTDYGKSPEYLAHIEDGPCALSPFEAHLAVSIGGIEINRNCQVVRPDLTPIEGLYSAGVDSAMYLRENYHIEVPCTAMGNNINSARTAVRHFAENR